MPNILVVCGKNKRRSRTAEHLFRNDQRFAIRSAGLSPESNRRLTAGDLHWADLVLVMEKKHRTRLREAWPQVDLPPVEILEIPDEYDYMQEELVDLLRESINAVLNEHYGL